MTYYRDELLHLVSNWNVEQIDHYIWELEERMRNTHEQIRALKQLRRRKVRNVGLKDTGTRGGK